MEWGAYLAKGVHRLAREKVLGSENDLLLHIFSFLLPGPCLTSDIEISDPHAIVSKCWNGAWKKFFSVLRDGKVEPSLWMKMDCLTVPKDNRIEALRNLIEISLFKENSERIASFQEEKLNLISSAQIRCYAQHWVYSFATLCSPDNMSEELYRLAESLMEESAQHIVDAQATMVAVVKFCCETDQLVSIFGYLEKFFIKYHNLKPLRLRALEIFQKMKDGVTVNWNTLFVSAINEGYLQLVRPFIDSFPPDVVPEALVCLGNEGAHAASTVEKALAPNQKFVFYVDDGILKPPVFIPFDHPLVRHSGILSVCATAVTTRGTSANIVIPGLFNMEALKKSMAFYVFHDDPDHQFADIPRPVPSANMADFVCEYDADLVATEEGGTELIHALTFIANQLDLKPLLDLACAKIATMIKGKTPEEIRRTFNIVNDFTPEEEAQVREENLWCEEG